MADNKAQIVIGAENRAEGVINKVRSQLGGLRSDAEPVITTFTKLGVVFSAAFAGGSFLTYIKGAVDGLDKLNDIAEVTGASVEKISALEDIGARTGAGIEVVEQALLKFNAVLKDADGKDAVSQELKRIGLSVQALKNLDPADALLQTSQALAGLADDGDRARLVQDLFGKSVKEVGGFLRDLAEKGQLNATVTREQVLQAKLFKEQLAELQKNSIDTARSIAGPLVSSLNSLFDKFKQFDGVAGFIKADLGIDKLGLLKTESAQLSEEVTRSTDTVLRLNEALSRDPDNKILAGRLDKARERLDKLRQQAAFTAQALKNVADEIAPPDTGDAFSRRVARGEGGRSLGDTRAAVAASAIAKQPQRGIEGLAIDRIEAFRLSELATQSIVNEALATSRLNDAEALRQAGLKAIAAATERVNQLISATPSGVFEQQQADIEILRKAFEATTISVEQYVEAVRAISAPTKQLTSDIDEFAKQAARNIQDQLGESLYDAATGNFKNIGDDFAKLLLRMSTQAAAADIGKGLFGDVGKDGQGIGGLVGSLAGLFGGARAKGGDVKGGLSYLVGEEGPELFTPGGSGSITSAKQTAAAMGGRALYVTNNFTITGPVTRQTQEQLASSAFAGAARAYARKG